MIINDDRISELVNIFQELAETSGGMERTSIWPNLLVVDSSPADLGSTYIIIEDNEGFYIPALKVPGVTYADGDYVNVLFIKGTEPIAFQQGAGSPGGGVGPHNILSSPHTDTLADDVVAGDLLYGNSTPLWARLPVGSDGDVLTVASGVPAWSAGGSGAEYMYRYQHFL